MLKRSLIICSQFAELNAFLTSSMTTAQFSLVPNLRLSPSNAFLAMSIALLIAFTVLNPYFTSERAPLATAHASGGLNYMNYIHNWSLQPLSQDYWFYFYWEIFCGNCIYSQSFCQKSAVRKSPKVYFLYFCLPGFTSNKPTHYLLHYGDLYYPLQYFSQRTKQTDGPVRWLFNWKFARFWNENQFLLLTVELLWFELLLTEFSINWSTAAASWREILSGSTSVPWSFYKLKNSSSICRS